MPANAVNGSFRPHCHHARLSAVGRCRSSGACVGHKYADHCPLYRQSQIFAREGIDLDRSTLAGWGGQSSKLLEPLADAIGRYVRSGQAIFADDTPIKMQGRKRCATARIWTYVRDERPWNSQVPLAAWCKFSTNRQGKHPTDHLSRYKGWIHADGHLSRFTPNCTIITPLRPLRARKDHTLQPPS